MQRWRQGLSQVQQAQRGRQRRGQAAAATSSTAVKLVAAREAGLAMGVAQPPAGVMPGRWLEEGRQCRRRHLCLTLWKLLRQQLLQQGSRTPARAAAAVRMCGQRTEARGFPQND